MILSRGYLGESSINFHETFMGDSLIYQALRQIFSEGGSFDTAGGLGAAQGSQKPFGI